jgi:hypothetical protein
MPQPGRLLQTRHDYANLNCFLQLHYLIESFSAAHFFLIARLNGQGNLRLH